MGRNETRGYAEGRQAYRHGQSVEDCPYNASAYAYTDEGLARDGWRKGFEFEWYEEGCPAERWPDLANTVAATERRASRKLGM